MIKRIAIISLLLVYITVTTGFTMATHFCKDRVASVSFSPLQKPGCGKMEMPMNCCRDEHIQVKISDDHEVVSNAIKFQALSLTLFVTPFHSFVIPQHTIENSFADYHSPPLYPGTSLSIVNSVFRI